MVNIVLVNLNQVQLPAIGPYAIDILGSALEEAGHGVEVLDLTFCSDPEETIDRYFMAKMPDITALTLRNTFDVYFPSFLDLPTKGSFLDSHEKLISRIKEYVSPQQILLGGVGFSIAPEPLLQRFGLRYGVQGPGEQKFVELADRFDHAGRISDFDFEVFDGRHDSLQGKVYRKFCDNYLYYERGGLGNLRTSNWCWMSCSYCVEPFAKGKGFNRRSVDNVIFEIDQLVAMGINDIQTADSEFNMPLKHSKEVLRAIIERNYNRDVRFWAYCQPLPFDEEFAELMAEANFIGINFGTDHVDADILRRLGKWYIKKDIQKTQELCAKNGIYVMHELLFGYPGDSPEKMYKSLEFMLGLDSWVLGVTIGLAVLPKTVLADYYHRATNSGKVEGFYVGGEALVDPTFYVDPSFKIPQVFDRLREFIGDDMYKVMIPNVQSTLGENNQLIGSKRLEQQLLVEKRKGQYWYHYRDR